MSRELIFGRQPVRETLLAGRREVFRVLSAPGLGGGADTLALVARRGISHRTVEPSALDSMCSGGHHQGIAAEVGGYPYTDLEAVFSGARKKGEAPLVLVLDHIQDPQNVGAILRVAEAAGVHGVVIPRQRAASVTPAVVRASAGASEHMLVTRVSNIAQTLDALKSEGVWTAGLESLPDSKVYTEADLKGPLALVVGSEAEGLARLVRETCDLLIRIPMRGRVSSLNAATAAAVALYEVRRQRDRDSG